MVPAGGRGRDEYLGVRGVLGGNTPRMELIIHAVLLHLIPLLSTPGGVGVTHKCIVHYGLVRG